MIPTWDLFIIVVFIITAAYSFMIGKEKTVKMIIASYIALLTADGVGNLISDYFIGSNAAIDLFPGADTASFIVLFKILFFLLAIVFLVMNGGFATHVSGSGSRVVSLTVNLILGVLSGGLIISAILIYASGASILFQDLVMSNSFKIIVYDQSSLTRWLIDNASIVFALPALLFVLASVFGSD